MKRCWMVSSLMAASWMVSSLMAAFTSEILELS